jgi:UDP-N-acetylglucosamine 1-carboxyvinyltransferase
MSRFVIHGGQPLAGEIVASGNKNAVLPMLAACLLTDKEVIFENVPRIRDVDAMLAILEHLGAEVAREDQVVRVRAANIKTGEIPRELCEAARTSFLFAGPLLTRVDRVKLYAPGGDGIGRRRLDAHLYGLRGLGVAIDDEELVFHAPRGRFQGAFLFFDEASVTATEHILMAAALCEGETRLLNAAGEPHVQDLVKLLNAMGADIDGAGTNSLTIRGVEKLGGARHRVVSDHIEVGSYLALAAATGGEITVHDTVRGHYWMTHRVFERFGLELEIGRDHIHLPGGQRPRIQADAGAALPRIDDGPWPQFPSDMMSAMIVLATQSEGPVLFFEKMFESRLYFIDPLIQMGANIIVCDPHRIVVQGRTALRGQTVRSPDIRAGMAMIIAALCAGKQPSIVQNAEVIDRGYERLEEKLLSLGADIGREADPG